MSEFVSAESKLGNNFTQAPRVMTFSDDLNTEICSRSVNRLLNENFDFNKILSENTGSWTDDQFNRDNMYMWEDMRVNEKYAETARLSDTTLKRMSEVFPMEKYSLFGSDSISPKDAVEGPLGDCWLHAAASAVANDP